MTINTELERKFRAKYNTHLSRLIIDFSLSYNILMITPWPILSVSTNNASWFMKTSPLSLSLNLLPFFIFDLAVVDKSIFFKKNPPHSQGCWNSHQELGMVEGFSTWVAIPRQCYFHQVHQRRAGQYRDTHSNRQSIDVIDFDPGCKGLTYLKVCEQSSCRIKARKNWWNTTSQSSICIFSFWDPCRWACADILIVAT